MGGGALCEGGVGVYSKLGHAEAVSIRLPPTAIALESASRVFFSSFVPLGNHTFGREDVFDQGPGYRAFIALPGGLASPLLPAVRRANLHGMALVAGKGSDPDTFGTNRVYVLDSGAYAFHYTASRAGDYRLSVMIGADEVACAPGLVSVRAGV